MIERCHCIHTISKRACQHKGFCDYINDLETVNRLAAVEIGELKAEEIIWGEYSTGVIKDLKAKVKELETALELYADDDSSEGDVAKAALKEDES